MPPTNIEASACTRQIDVARGVNHRSPGVSQMTLACSAASSPATRLRREDGEGAAGGGQQRDGVERRGGRGGRDGGLIP